MATTITCDNCGIKIPEKENNYLLKLLLVDIHRNSNREEIGIDICKKCFKIIKKDKIWRLDG